MASWRQQAETVLGCVKDTLTESYYTSPASNSVTYVLDNLVWRRFDILQVLHNLAQAGVDRQAQNRRPPGHCSGNIWHADAGEVLPKRHQPFLHAVAQHWWVGRYDLGVTGQTDRQAGRQQERGRVSRHMRGHGDMCVGGVATTSQDQYASSHKARRYYTMCAAQSNTFAAATGCLHNTAFAAIPASRCSILAVPLHQLADGAQP